MRQWEDDTLVTIKPLDNGKFKVIELPARHTETVTSRRSFTGYEQAEQYIDDQYPTALSVQPEDIEEEKRIRSQRRAECEH
jgi:hypothetical protein